MRKRLFCSAWKTLTASFSRVPVLLLLAFLTSSQMSSAQTSGTGALTGIVTDPTGGAVVGAKVVVTSLATRETRTVMSNSRGLYLVPSLLPGLYSVEVSMNGFKTLAVPQAKVTVTETAALNLRLQIGAVMERVTVEARTEPLQTQSSALGQVTSGEQVRALPLVTRNFTQIMALNSGVSAEVTNAGDLGRGGPGNSGAPIVSNGVSENDNNVQMNGVGVNDLQSSGDFSGGVPIPNPDTIQEFKVQTSQFDAAYGRNAGANVDVVTKGGTNQFHGSLWEFFRNDDLNANTFFLNLAHQPRAVLKENQFGFDLGGPIVRDKLTFFTSYQGTRQRNGLDSNCSSNIVTPVGVNGGVLTDDRSPGALGALFGGESGVFGGTAVAPDGSNINPVALNLLQLKKSDGQYLIPSTQTITNTPAGPEGFSAFSIACPYSEDQFMTNGDWNISPKSTLAARFFFSDGTTTQSLPLSHVGGFTPPGFPVNLTSNFRTLSLTHTYTFSPQVLNQIVVAYHRSVAIFDQTRAFTYAQVGANVPSFDNAIPAINIDFFNSQGLSLGGNGQGTHFAQNNYVVQDSLAWTQGRHNFRFGGGFTRIQNNEVNFHFLGGAFYGSWPDFLLGLDGTANGSGFSNVLLSEDLPGLFDRAYRVWEINAYAQDDIKVSRRFTLNLGLRYDHLGDMADSLGRNASFDFSAANPNPPPDPGTLQGTVLPSNYSGPVPAGARKSDNAFGMNGDGQNTWNPRVGFAWQLPGTERLVLRGGYGIYHSRFTGQPFFQLLTAPPFAQLRVGGAFAPVFGGTYVNATEQVPFPLNTPTFPAFVPYSQTTNNSLTVFDPKFRPPIIQHYSLGLQSELTKNTVLEVSYSGARGLHLIRERLVNQAQIASNSNIIRGQNTNTLANIGDRVPLQGFSPSGADQIESAGASWYNGLLVTLNHRFSHGLRAQGAYTFAKNLSADATSPLGAVSAADDPNGGGVTGDQNNPKQRYGPDGFVRAHRLVVNYTYDFPSPKFANAMLSQAIGGWSVSGVTTAQTGHHLTATYVNNFSVYGITNDRASLSGACSPGHYLAPGHKFNNYINPACFTAPPVFDPTQDPNALGFGNSGVGIIDGPGQFDWDIAIVKKFGLRWPREGSALEFRSEFFNAFNHTQFKDPDSAFSDGPESFGKISDIVVSPRVIQFALKFNF